MTDCGKCICSAAQKLEERQAYIRDIRSDLISNHRFRRTEGLRRLYVELLESGDLWADRIGYASRVDVREGFAAGLVELVLILAFEDEWPPDPEGFISFEDAQDETEDA